MKLKKHSILALFLMLNTAVFAQLDPQVQSVTGWVRYTLDDTPTQVLERKYDISGKLVESNNEQLHTYIKYIYDEQGRVLQSGGMEGEVEYFSDYVYRGLVTIQKDKNVSTGETITTEIYYEDTTKKKELENKTYEGDRLVSRVIYTYNELGKVGGETHYVFADSGTKNKKTFYTYDSLSQLLKTTIVYDFDGKIAYQHSYTYNDDQTLQEERREDFKNNQHKSKIYSYYRNGQTSSIIEQDLRSDQRKVYTYSYFPNGKLERESVITEDKEAVKLTMYKIYAYRDGGLWKVTTHSTGAEGELNQKNIDIYKEGKLIRSQNFTNNQLTEIMDYHYTYFE